MESNKILSHQGIKSQDKSSESIFSFSKSPVRNGIETLSRIAVPNQNHHLAKPVFTTSATDQPFPKLQLQPLRKAELSDTQKNQWGVQLTQHNTDSRGGHRNLQLEQALSGRAHENTKLHDILTLLSSKREDC